LGRGSRSRPPVEKVRALCGKLEFSESKGGKEGRPFSLLLGETCTSIHNKRTERSIALTFSLTKFTPVPEFSKKGKPLEYAYAMYDVRKGTARGIRSSRIPAVEQKRFEKRLEITKKIDPQQASDPVL
jgi:hypothetical protein